MLHRSLRAQDLAPRTFHDVVPGIVSEPSQRHRAADRFGLGWDDTVDLAPLETAIDLGVGVAGIRGCSLDRDAGCFGGGIEPREAAEGNLSGRWPLIPGPAAHPPHDPCPCHLHP